MSDLRNCFWGGKAPSQTHSHFTQKPSISFLHISSIFHTFVCFWSKLSLLSKFLKQNRCDSCGWYSNILLNKQKCGQINWIRARKFLRLRWCGLKFEFFSSKKFLSGNFIFNWPYLIEYGSDLHEKWMVREVSICSFWGVVRKNGGLVVKGLSGVALWEVHFSH